MVRLGYLGPRGTFSEAAARAHAAPGGLSGAELSPCATIAGVADALAAGTLDRAVVPIENSFEGGVDDAADSLLRHESLVIYAELVLPIRHCLIGAADVALAAVRRVRSHPQALRQCHAWLSRHVPGATREESASTAAAVEALEPDHPEIVAVAPAFAAELHSMRVLASDLQGTSDNRTRFIALARADAAPGSAPTGADRTSLALVVPHRPGGLVRALGVFDALDVNMTRIESRPGSRVASGGLARLGEAVLLIDVEGHRDDMALAAALAALARKAEYLRVLGSYPRADAP